MTVRKAIKLCDYLTIHYLKHAQGMRDVVKDWEPKETQSLGLTIADTIEDVSKCIGAIKSQIQPKCRHPKKMRDGKPGERYCMNCNLDMDD